MMPELIGLVAAIAVAAVLLSLSIRIIPQGTERTVERFGRFARLQRPGLRWLVPLIERNGHRQVMSEQVLEIPTLEVIVGKQVALEVGVSCFYQVFDAAMASYEVANLDASLRHVVVSALRTGLANLDMRTILTRRDDLSRKLLDMLDPSTEPWGVKVTRLEFQEIAPPKDLVDAVKEKLAAELRREAAVLLAEGEQQAASLRARAEKHAHLALAEADKERADLEAAAKERPAEADARAAVLLSRALEQGDSRALSYLLGQSYIDAIRTLAQNGRATIVPLDTSKLSEGLDGIAELARATSATDEHRTNARAEWTKSPVSGE
ncbi:MAG: SPFH/Band 7/PHB domain protein [Gammaproteobacteria bacterium]